MALLLRTLGECVDRDGVAFMVGTRQCGGENTENRKKQGEKQGKEQAFKVTSVGENTKTERIGRKTERNRATI